MVTPKHPDLRGQSVCIQTNVKDHWCFDSPCIEFREKEYIVSIFIPSPQPYTETFK